MFNWKFVPFAAVLAVIIALAVIWAAVPGTGHHGLTHPAKVQSTAPAFGAVHPTKLDAVKSVWILNAFVAIHSKRGLTARQCKSLVRKYVNVYDRYVNPMKSPDWGVLAYLMGAGVPVDWDNPAKFPQAKYSWMFSCAE